MANVAQYVDCAFNFNNKAEAFIFTGNQCLQINYARGKTEDFIIKGPKSIADFFPSQSNTIFANGIDAAFTSTVENEVYIFKKDNYALLNFVNGFIKQASNKITVGFPCLKNTIFEAGIDAAFASPQHKEAYIFKGDKYAVIRYEPARTTNAQFVTLPQDITVGFPYLKGTIFEDGLDAAFSAKETYQAYIFKRNHYYLINYAPGTQNFIERVTPITTGFRSLEGIIPGYT